MVEVEENSDSSAPLQGFITEEMESIFWLFHHNKPLDMFHKVCDYNYKYLDMELYSRRKLPTSDLKEFLVVGTVKVSLEKLLALVMHAERRAEWDATYIEHKMLPSDAEKSDFIYSVSRFPFPLAKRTYLVRRTVYKNDADVVAVYGRIVPNSVVCEPIPKRYKWSLQIDEFECMLVLKPAGEGLCHMLFTYYENPKVFIPNTYLNMLIQGLVPSTLKRLIIACKDDDLQAAKEYCDTIEFVTLEPKDS